MRVGTAIALTSLCCMQPTLAQAEDKVWSGYSVGVHTGIASSDYFGEHDTAEAPLFFDDVDGIEAILGIQLAYDFQFESDFVLGVGADLSFGFRNTSGPTSAEGDFLESKTDYFASAGVRAGYALEDWLLYMRGGLAFADYEATINDVDNGVSAVADEGNAGVFFGGGFQWRVSNHLSTTTEGVYYAFDDINSTASVTPDSDPADRFGFDGAALLRFGLNYHF